MQRLQRLCKFSFYGPWPALFVRPTNVCNVDSLWLESLSKRPIVSSRSSNGDGAESSACSRRLGPCCGGLLFLQLSCGGLKCTSLYRGRWIHVNSLIFLAEAPKRTLQEVGGGDEAPVAPVIDMAKLNRELHQACNRGNTDEASALLDQGAQWGIFALAML